MKYFFLILLSCSVLTVKAQPEVDFHLLFGLDAYSWNRTPKLDTIKNHVHSGNAILNPNVGCSGTVYLTDYMSFVLSSSVNYSITSFSLSGQKTFGSLNIPIQGGFGFGNFNSYRKHDNTVKKAALHLVGYEFLLLYGYQFNFVDLYRTNTNLLKNDRYFPTHSIEFAVGGALFGHNVKGQYYGRVGFNKLGAWSLNVGIRLGLTPNFF
ncbi:MAG TPA: hypothetical protein PLP27_05815 [Crocinitomicaceae bacterium]|nr:hypothetical protein [Crocinitomicaceae bacterium]